MHTKSIRQELVCDGLQQCQLSCFLSSLPARSLFYGAAAVPRGTEFHPARVQPRLLRLRRAEVFAAHAALHRHQLLLRAPRGGKAPSRRPKGRRDARGCAGARASRLVQVRGLFRRNAPRPDALYPRAAGHAAHRHLIFYLSRPQLCDRRFPRCCRRAEKSAQARALYLVFPPARRRSHRALHHGRRRDRRAARVRFRILRGRGALSLRPC